MRMFTYLIVQNSDHYHDGVHTLNINSYWYSNRKLKLKFNQIKNNISILLTNLSEFELPTYLHYTDG